jgi:hypothetical protein
MMNELRVTEVVEISGRGVALFFERDPNPVPAQHQLRVRIVRPDGTETYSEASREFARKVPPGEVVSFLVPNLRRSDVPVGSMVSIVKHEHV